MHYSAFEYFFDRANELIERSLIKAVLADDFLCAEVASKEYFEQSGGVGMSLSNDTVLIMNAKASLWEDTK